MAKSQFEKRKEKLSDDLVKKVEDKLEEIKSAPKYTQEAYDVFYNGKDYNVATIEYSPETGEARVKELFNITRLVGMTYSNHKKSLSILKKQKLK